MSPIKVMLHDIDSLTREKDEMLHDLRVITGLEIRSTPQHGLLYKLHDGSIVHSSKLYVFTKAELLPHPTETKA